MDNTATPRQRWALYCITKKDYRNEVLSKEEAAKLIKELGDPQYKKKNSKKTIEDELLDYLKEHIHKYGNTVTPFEVIIRATGESFNPKYYIDYLKEKYTKLYEIA